MSVESLLAKANEGMHAGRAFGPVMEADGCLVIPVAITAGGGGGGGDVPDGDGTAVDGGVGTGYGGGFGGVTWPLGVYVVKDGTARWVPAIDVTRVALGVLALVRVGMRLRARRAGR